MGNRPTQLDKAIKNMEDEIAVLQLALAKLKAQQAKAPARKLKVAKSPTTQTAS